MASEKKHFFNTLRARKFPDHSGVSGLQEKFGTTFAKRLVP